MDGFEEEIEVVLKDPPQGFLLHGGRTPKGKDRICMTLAVPVKVPDRPVALQLEGQATVAGKTIRRPAAGAEDTMQAFLYRHLVPSQELLVIVQKSKWSMPPMALASGSPVRIPAGGTAQVRIKTPKWGSKGLLLDLHEPPEGLTLRDVKIVPEGLTFELAADKDALQAGFTDNLIVKAFRETQPKKQKGKPTPKKRRNSAGILPAIPIEIVQRQTSMARAFSDK